MRVSYSLFLFCSGLLAFGESLVCYECTGSKIKDCYPPMDKSIKAFDCESSTFITGHENPSYKCIAYLERDKIHNGTTYSRHCINTRQKNFCETYTKSKAHHNVIVEDCMTCSEDLCNSAETLKVTLLVVLSLLLFICNWF